jgi:hypothetical protein
MTESGSVPVRHQVILVARGEFSQPRFSENSRHNICIEHNLDQCRDEIAIPLQI